MILIFFCRKTSRKEEKESRDRRMEALSDLVNN